MRFSGPRPGQTAAKKLGVIGTVILWRIDSALDAMKRQAMANTEELLDSELEEGIRDILTEQFRDVLIPALEEAKQEKELSFNSESLGNYRYAPLTLAHKARKASKYGYPGFRLGHPYKDKFYMENRSDSLVGALKTLSNQSDFGEKYFDNLGARRGYVVDRGSEKYRPDSEHYKRMAERKKRELAKNSRVL